MNSYKEGTEKWFGLVDGLGIHLSMGTIIIWKNSFTNPYSNNLDPRKAGCYQVFREDQTALFKIKRENVFVVAKRVEQDERS